MDRPNKYLLIFFLFFASCEKQASKSERDSLKSGQLDGELVQEDLLNHSILEKVLSTALPIEDLNWSDDGAPAMQNGMPYTGWIKQSSGPVFGVAFLSDGIDDGPFLLIHSNGEPSMTGAFSKGLKSGKWISWDENGHIESEESWLRGEKLP
jgi:antitoxin component YwqK of YwqJK toxin-antitoxin module